MDRDTRNARVAAIAGLMIAWGGTALLLSPADRLLGPPERLVTRVLEQLALWVLFGSILSIVVLWERQPLASMGLRRPGLATLGWGLLLAAAIIYAAMPLLTLGLRLAGVPAFEAGMAKVLILPLWFRIFAVVTAGIVEDTLFLGYAFTRLARLTGSYWLGGIVSVAVSSFLHLPYWGIGPALAYLVVGAITTGFFVWRRDLLANIVAHTVVDGMALVVMPAFSQALIVRPFRW